MSETVHIWCLLFVLASCGDPVVDPENVADKNPEEDMVLKPVNEFVLSDVSMTAALRKSVPMEIEAAGLINYDTRKTEVVSSRVSGWIEKLYIKYPFQPVVKGQKLLEIYSRELVLEQENYLFLLRHDSTNNGLIQSAEKRLLLSGLTVEEISRIRNSGKSIRTIALFSTYTGHIHEFGEPAVALSTNDGMNMGNSGASSADLVLREGMFVSKGEKLFNIYSTTNVWAEIDLYQDDIATVEVGMPVFLTSPGENPDTIHGKIDFIEPGAGTGKTIRTRVYLANPGERLKIGTRISAHILAGREEGLFLCRSAVTSLGNKYVVFVKSEGGFRPKEVLVGAISENDIEIVSGIGEKDSVAENAQMLIDSESFIKLRNEGF
jgi:Cu(I)/Ag(I) efflux system membrane fusion protein